MTVWVAFAYAACRRWTPRGLALVAGAALWAHAAMFVVAGLTQRYLLAWDLSVIVLIVWALGGSGAGSRADSFRRNHALAVGQ